MTFRPHPAKAPAALLRQTRPLQSLFEQACRLSHLQQLLESQLQPAAREHCRVASWSGGCLLLVISDGHWATRLRYQQRRLQRQLEAIPEFAGLQRILFKVRPTQHTSTAPRRLSLSTAAAESLHTTAEGIRDPQLRAALERLASHARPTQD
jgi:hypothetical protein